MPGQLIVSGRQEYVVCDSTEAVSVVDPSCQRSSHQTPGEHGHPRPEMLILGEFRGLASA